MKLPIKMYLILIFGVSVILYQYNLSYVNTWVIKDNSDVELSQMYNSNFKAKSNFTNSNGEKSQLLSSVNIESDANIPPLYIITPTYRRPEQIAEITRLSHTLMLVPNVYWLVVEDANVTTPLVTEILRKTGLPFSHLLAPMPEQFKNKKKGPKPRGVANRNKGLEWVRQNAQDGVFYFADDDNTYDLQIFKEMRFTKKISMFPVGLITKLGVSSPVIKNGEFVGFYDGWIAGRKFPVDMAGFAISVKFLLERPEAIMPFKPGYEEDGFLKSLQPFEQKEIEVLASNCSKIYVWHTQSKKNERALPVDISKFNNTNIIKLREILV